MNSELIRSGPVVDRAAADKPRQTPDFRLLVRQAQSLCRRLDHGSLKRLLQLIAALAGELSDEAAYARYLDLHHAARSARAWRAFSETKMREKFGRPKCC